MILESISQKIGRVFSKFGSPAKWVILSLIFTALASYFIIKEVYLYATICFILLCFFELIDGAVVRLTSTRSKLSSYLDAISNVYIEGAILFAMLFGSLPDFFFPIRGWIAIYMFGFLVAYYVKAASREKEVIRTEIKGLLERYERWIILGVGLLLAVFDHLYLSYIIVILAILTNLSAFQRIYAAVAYTRNKFTITTKINR